jgi:hypothetical protein
MTEERGEFLLKIKIVFELNKHRDRPAIDGGGNKSYQARQEEKYSGKFESEALRG